MRRDTDDRLMRSYRTIRHVVGGTDAPWAGALVRLESGEIRLLVDTALLAHDWVGWNASATGHVLAPLDVIRRPEGHDAMFPAFTMRIESFLEQRRIGRAPLTAGEAVTLAVSLTRGLAELGSEGWSNAGEWWLTDAGRPVLAVGSGDDPARDRTLVLLEHLAVDRRDTALWRGLIDDVAADTTGRILVRAEDRLFASAEAEPLSDPGRAQSSGLHPGGHEPMTLERARLQAAATTHHDEPPRGIVERLVGHIDRDVGDLVSTSVTSVWRRMRSARRGGRGRPWLFAAGLAGVVVAAGVLWPTDSPAPAATNTPSTGSTVATSTPSVESTVTTSPSASPSSSESAAHAAPADLVDVTSGLLTTRMGCAGDRECLGDVVVDPDASFPAGVIDEHESARSVELVDEFGGVAVMRVTADGRESQLVVIQRQEDRWLLRDVYVAQQP